MRPDRKLTDSRCQCSGCNEYFNSDSAFDKHRVGEFGRAIGPNIRRCLSPDEMRAEGMVYKTQPGGQKWWVGSEREGGFQPYPGRVKGGSAEKDMHPDVETPVRGER